MSSSRQPRPARDFHASAKAEPKQNEVDTAFTTYSTCGLDPNQVNPDDAWQCKPITLRTKGLATEIRRDYLFDEYVIISPGRGKRPYDTSKNRHPLVETAQSPKLEREKQIFRLGPEDDWFVKVVENKYPALTMDNPRAHGKQELVVDTPRANIPFAHLSTTQIERILGVYQLRIQKLMAQDDIAYVLVFRNDGFEAGASLAHAHSQIFALPIIPKRFVEHSVQIENFYIEKRKEPIEDIIGYEHEQKVRVIAEDEHLMAICPYASQWPFEAWLIPKTHVLRFDELTTASLQSCAKFLKQLTGKLTDSQISYNFFIENGTSPHYRCIVKLYGRSNIWGGFEAATGMVINTVPPEAAAEWYRAK